MMNSSRKLFRKNAFLEKLNERQLQIGLWCSFANADIVELLSLCAPDWVLFDMEHTAVGVDQLAGADRAAHAAGSTLIARIPKLDIAEMKRALDAGVQSVFVPQIRSARDAEKAVSFATFPPDGERGVAGATRAARFGHWGADNKALQQEIAVIVQIETVEALADIDKIAATPGLSAVFVGPADLSASLGHMDNLQHPDVISAIDRILDAGSLAEAPVGIFAGDVGMAKRWIEKGASFISVGQDTSLLLSAAKERMDTFRQ